MQGYCQITKLQRRATFLSINVFLRILVGECSINCHSMAFKLCVFSTFFLLISWNIRNWKEQDGDLFITQYVLLFYYLNNSMQHTQSTAKKNATVGITTMRYSQGAMDAFNSHEIGWKYLFIYEKAELMKNFGPQFKWRKYVTAQLIQGIRFYMRTRTAI